jgi:hypothetical protein
LVDGVHFFLLLFFRWFQSVNTRPRFILAVQDLWNGRFFLKESKGILTLIYYE